MDTREGKTSRREGKNNQPGPTFVIRPNWGGTGERHSNEKVLQVLLTFSGGQNYVSTTIRQSFFLLQGHKNKLTYLSYLSLCKPNNIPSISFFFFSFLFSNMLGS